METKIKREYQRMYYNATQYCKRFAASWDYSIAAKGAYVQGWRDAKESPESGEEIIEVEGTEGDHQLSDTTMRRWKREVRDLPFKDAMKSLMTHYNFSDINVHEKDGFYSFQGIAKKK